MKESIFPGDSYICVYPFTKVTSEGILPIYNVLEDGTELHLSDKDRKWVGKNQFKMFLKGF